MTISVEEAMRRRHRGVCNLAVFASRLRKLDHSHGGLSGLTGLGVCRGWAHAVLSIVLVTGKPRAVKGGWGTALTRDPSTLVGCCR